MANFRVISAIFVILTVIFAATTAYLAVSPVKTTVVSTTTTTTTLGSQDTVDIAYKSGIGFYLTNSSGYALYFRSTDTPNSGNTTCNTDTCEKNWPAFYSATLSLPTGLNASEFGTITPYNTTKIVTYHGYPLFYWVHDAKPGDTTGQGIGGFYVATVPAPTKPGSTASASSTAYTVNVANGAKLGSYLANSAGFTLYYLANDTVGTAASPPVSKCTTVLACISVWPPFYASKVSVPPGLNASDFSTFTRADGSNQTAYKGHPLYLYAGDTSPGQASGQGLNSNGGLWFVASVNGSLP